MRELGLLLVVFGIGLVFTTYTGTTGQLIGAIFGSGTPSTTTATGSTGATATGTVSGTGATGATRVGGTGGT